MLVRSCFLITLIKCLKGHKSLGSLCSVAKTLIVSGVRQTDQGARSPIELLWTAKNDKYEVCIYDCHKSLTHIFWNTSPTSSVLVGCSFSWKRRIQCALLTAHGRDSNFPMHHPVQLWCDALKKCFAEKRNSACAVSGRTNCFLTREGTKQNVSFKQFWGGQQNHVLTHLGNSDKNWNRQIFYCLLYTYIEV